MGKKRIMIQMPVTAGIRSVLDGRDDVEYERFTELSEENILQHIANYDGAILGGVASFTARIVGNAPRLKVVSRHGVGYDNVDVPALTAAGVPLTVTGTANSVTVAEHSLFFMMSLAKHGVLFDREVRKGNWDIRFENTAIDLAGRRVLILGFGRIGQLLVKRCVALDMVVSVHDPYANDEAIREAGAEPVTDWRATLPGLDFLSVNCPKTDETTGMVGTAELAAMKGTAYVVNTARGGIVDEAALVDALDAPGDRRGRDRRIRGRARDCGQPHVRARQYPGESPFRGGHGGVHVPDGGLMRPERGRLFRREAGSRERGQPGGAGLRPPRYAAFPAARAGNARGEAIRPLADSRPRTGRGGPVRL